VKASEIENLIDVAGLKLLRRVIKMRDRR